MELIDSKENIIRMVNQYRNLVFSICLKLTGDYFIAEDLTQETFLAAYQCEKCVDLEKEKAWLARIASNKSIDYLREASRKSIPFPEEEMPEAAGDEQDNPLCSVLCKELMQTFYQNCDELSPPYGEIARLHFREGLTAREIAERTGTGLKTIQTQIYRARELLKKKLRKEELLG